MPLDETSDVVAAGAALTRFLYTTTDSLWADLEDKLADAVGDSQEFRKLAHSLPDVHFHSAILLAKHILQLAQYNYTVEEWCCKFHFFL